MGCILLILLLSHCFSKSYLLAFIIQQVIVEAKVHCVEYFHEKTTIPKKKSTTLSRTDRKPQVENKFAVFKALLLFN